MSGYDRTYVLGLLPKPGSEEKDYGPLFCGLVLCLFFAILMARAI